MNKLIKDESSVLVIDGVPFSLVRDNECQPCVVCDKCDLRHLCIEKDTNTKYIDLCMSEGRSSSWYFIIDWDIVAKRIFDYLDIACEELNR